MLFLSLSRLCKITAGHILYGKYLAYGIKREESIALRVLIRGIITFCELVALFERPLGDKGDACLSKNSLANERRAKLA